MSNDTTTKPEGQSIPQISWDDSKMQTTYANVCNVLGTREEIMLISTGGVLIRTPVNDIRVMGRSTQGVTLINLDDGTYLAGLEKVVETEGLDGEVDEGLSDEALPSEDPEKPEAEA